MATPTEYYIKYTYTGQSNTSTSGGSGSSTTPAVKTALQQSAFKLSGNTNVKIGLVTRIVYLHTHTSTSRPTWQLQGRITLADGTTLLSDVQAASFNANLVTVTNTFTDVMDASAAKTWTQIETLSRGTDGGTLYWRATTDSPMEVYIYFYDMSAVCEGADPPTWAATPFTVTDGSSIRFSDNTTGSAYGKTGVYVQNFSEPVITGNVTLDPNYPYISAQYTLVVTRHSNGKAMFQKTQADDATFHVGAITKSGLMDYTMTVIDSAGNVTERSGSFTVTAYSAPTLANVSAERYTSRMTDDGEIIYIAAEDGEFVRFSLTGKVAQINGANAWNLALVYGADESSASTTMPSVLSGTDGTAGATFVWNNNQDVLVSEGAPIEIDTAMSWTFSFTLVDLFNGSASGAGYVDESGAYFDVEPNGVAVGMRSTAEENEKKFEVAQGIGAYLYGGISEVWETKSSLAALGIQYGVIDPMQVASGSYNNPIDVVFDWPYLNVPQVMLTMYTETGAARNFGAHSPIVTEVDTGGFVCVPVSYTGALTYGLYWLAIGVPNTDPNARAVTIVKRPVSPLTSNTGGPCKASASTEYSGSYPAYKAFNGSFDSSWASATSDSAPWLQLQMDVALANMEVSIYGRSSRYIHNPTAGTIKGSNDGTTWTDIGSFSGWSESAQGKLLGAVQCEHDTAYKYVRIVITAHGDLNDDISYAAIGNVKIRGELGTAT